MITFRCTYFGTTTQGVSSHSEGLVHKVPTLYQLRQEAHHLITSEEPGSGRSRKGRDMGGGAKSERGEEGEEERGKEGGREGGRERGREGGRREGGRS